MTEPPVSGDLGMTLRASLDAIEITANALREGGFVDPDDDTMATFHSDVRPDTAGRINMWVSPLRAAQTVVAALGNVGMLVRDVPVPDTADDPASLPPGTWLSGEGVYALRWFTHPETDYDQERPWVVLGPWGIDGTKVPHDRVRGWTILPGSPTFPRSDGA